MGTHQTYYRAFDLEVRPQTKVQFEVKSYCACMGFDKRMFVPELAVFDGSGKPLQRINSELKVITDTGVMGFEPIHLKLTESIATGEATRIRILVAANTSKVDEAVGWISIVNAMGQRNDLSITSYPVGDFSVLATEVGN